MKFSNILCIFELYVYYSNEVFFVHLNMMGVLKRLLLHGTRWCNTKRHYVTAIEPSKQISTIGGGVVSPIDPTM